MPPKSQSASAFAYLQSFARDVKSKAALGERYNAQPEDHLKTSVAALVSGVGKSLGMKVEAVTEARVDDVSGRPDLAVTVDGLLVGYIELKAPGVGTTDRELRGRNRTQLRKFLNLPNLIYTDARDWTYYREGQRRTSFDLRLGDIDDTSDTGISENDAIDLTEILREFLGWQPIVPTNPRALAEQLAPMTRVIRTDVAEGVRRNGSALSGIYGDWRRTLFPEATPDEFADSYAQTLTYGLLLAKLSGATALDTHKAAQAIQHHSSLLSRTLEILTQQGTAEELGPGLQLLERTIDAVDPTALRSDGQDPWLYFYEDFLAVYDPRLRNERGVYYTPAQVVKAQVTLVDQLIRTKLGKQLGVADDNVTVLDPAVGTGTYLLRTLQQGVERARATYGDGATSGVATQMARRLYGFELLVGPYAVAHLRLTQAVQQAGGREPTDGVHVYLTDTLESPNEAQPVISSQFEQPLAEEHRRAREVKSATQVLVCIGNPPYEREGSGPEGEGQESVGGWIRFGDESTRAPLETFIAPAQRAGAGLHVKNLYNLYVYFWRWALWKVFESQSGPGVVSFITASSYLRGPGFVGMREEMRRTFDELWIVDLGGESRGTRTSENVFDIRTPVAIAIGVRYGEARRDEVAQVHYAEITGTRAEKFQTLNDASDFSDLRWQDGQSGWHEPLVPTSSGNYFEWAALADMFPWQHSGSQLKRLWPIAPTREVLQNRWTALLSSNARASLFRETRDRKIGQRYPDQLGPQGTLPAISALPIDAPCPEIVRYGYRSFDRQYVLRDVRVGDYYRPALWSAVSIRQVFLVSGLSIPLGAGPAAIAWSMVPDIDSFRGSFGAKHVVPLYRDAEATQPNVSEGMLELLSRRYGGEVTPEDLLAYVVGLIGHTGYTGRFRDELNVPGARVPITKSGTLFRRAVDLGRQVIAWQTYGDRFPEAIGASQGAVPSGAARVKVAIPDDADRYPLNLNEVRYDEDAQELHVGEGVIDRVDPRIWEYEVSGLRVVRSWLGYRVKERAGRKSSPLDDIRPERWTWEMTRELLDLLWVLEGVITLEPAQADLLDEIVAGDLFLADELPTPTDAERAAPRVERQQQMGLDLGI